VTGPWTDRVFLGRLAETLGNLIESQSADLFDRAGLAVPVKSCSLMLAIRALEPAAAVDLARHLDCSHQLVLQKIPKLLQLGLVDQQPCRQDRRRKLFRLTDEGRRNLVIADALFPAIERAYDGLGAGAADIYGAVEATLAALQARPLVERVELRGSGPVAGSPSV
jgi:DNA-binding MarR family transcriptional regulator